MSAFPSVYRDTLPGDVDELFEYAERHSYLTLEGPAHFGTPDPGTPQLRSPGLPAVPNPRTPQQDGDQRSDPATPFHCHLCNKRYTRAFALRNHLRTHSDERPFCCYLCNKAFTRNHDRKTHEKLHTDYSGGQFVCRGVLQQAGGVWGCGRRFNRGSNLARHFQSNRGRRCIQPLVDEESSRAAQTLTSMAGTDIRQEPVDPVMEDEVADAMFPPPAVPLNSASSRAGAEYGRSSCTPYWNPISYDIDPIGVMGRVVDTGTRSEYQPITEPPEIARPVDKLKLLYDVFAEKGFDVDAEVLSYLTRKRRLR